MKISVVTPTADRPLAFALTERYMARQTVQPDEWIVADGGMTPSVCTMGQIHIHAPGPAGAGNFGKNLLNGLAVASGDVIVFIEDDDWLRPDHIECLVAVAERFPLVGSESVQRYYNVAHRCWRRFDNVGASLCQTAIRRELWSAFGETVHSQMAGGRYGVDTTFWRSVPRSKWGMADQMTVLGIKGLPGRPGLGIGHRPDKRWAKDETFAQLHAWIGNDAELYQPYSLGANS